MPRLADRYLAHARRHLPEVEQRHDRLMSTEYIAMCLLVAGRLAEVKSMLVEMRDLPQAAAIAAGLLDATSLLILTLLERQEHATCAELLSGFVGEAERSGDPQLRCWSLLEAAELALRMSDLPAAERCLAAPLRDCWAASAATKSIWTTGLLALLDLRQARAPEALAKARQSHDGARRMARGRLFRPAGVYAATDVYLELLAVEAAALSAPM